MASFGSATARTALASRAPTQASFRFGSWLRADRRFVDEVAVLVDPGPAGRTRERGVGIRLPFLLSLVDVYDLAARGAADRSFCHASIFSARGRA